MMTKLKNQLIFYTLFLVANNLFAQSQFFHESLYSYLRKDVSVITKELKGKKYLKYELKSKDGQDSIRITYRYKRTNNFFTFFIVKGICVTIGVRYDTKTSEDTIELFRTKYNEVTNNDWPDYLDNYTTEELQAVAYFEDNSMNVGYIVFTQYDAPNQSIFVFYSRFMQEDL